MQPPAGLENDIPIAFLDILDVRAGLIKNTNAKSVCKLPKSKKSKFYKDQYDTELLALTRETNDDVIIKKVCDAFRRSVQTVVDGKMVSCIVAHRSCTIIIAVKQTVITHAITDQLALPFIRLIDDKDLRKGLLTKTTDTKQIATFQIKFDVDA